MNFVLHHIPDPVKGLKETARVLKKGGVFGVMESIFHKVDENEYQIFSLLKDILSSCGLKDKFESPVDQNNKDNEKKEMHVHKTFDRESLIKFLEENGFEVSLVYDDYAVVPVNSGDELIGMIVKSPWGQKICSSFSSDEIKLVEEATHKKFEEIKKNKAPLITRCIGVVAKNMN